MYRDWVWVRDLDQFPHRRRPRAHRALQEPKEQQPTSTSMSAVEPEGELIQEGLQVLGVASGLVGTGQPALQQARHPVYPRQ